MAELAAHWVERVIDDVPVRQWVLTVPWTRRLLLARNPKLSKGVLGVALKEVLGWYRQRAKQHLGLADARTGSVTVVQRFSSSLSLNLHFHTLVLDGVYAIDEQTGQPRFHNLPAPTTRDVEQLVVAIADNVERFLARHGYGPEDELDEVWDEDAQLTMQATSLAGRAALGLRAGRKVRRYQVLSGRQVKLPPRCAICDGYNLHAGVVVRDIEARERLCQLRSAPSRCARFAVAARSPV
jgi:hypothetical protein